MSKKHLLTLLYLTFLILLCELGLEASAKSSVLSSPIETLEKDSIREPNTNPTLCTDPNSEFYDYSTQTLKSPIDISEPFEYFRPNFTFTYSNMHTEYNFYNDGVNLILEGDFGYLSYQGTEYVSTQIHFFSPSQHTFSGHRFPIEMQVIHMNAKGDKILVSVLFKYVKNDYSILLGNLGFDNEDLSGQKPYDYTKIKFPFDMSKYIKDNKDFFIYDGGNLAPPCDRSSTYMILTDVIKVSQIQIENFPEIIKGKTQEIQKRNERSIYRTFHMSQVKEKVDQVKSKINEISSDEKSMKKFENENEKNAPPDQIEVKAEDKPEDISDASCGEKPLDLDTVKDKVNAIEASKKIQQPNYVNTPKNLTTNSSNTTAISTLDDTMIIDKDIPETQSDLQRRALEDKYQKWKELYIKLVSKDEFSDENFIQMNSLEKELSESKYMPYYDTKRNLIGEKTLGVSFLQDSEHTREKLVGKDGKDISSEFDDMNHQIEEHLDVLERFDRKAKEAKLDYRDDTNKSDTESHETTNSLVKKLNRLKQVSSYFSKDYSDKIENDNKSKELNNDGLVTDKSKKLRQKKEQKTNKKQNGNSILDNRAKLAVSNMNYHMMSEDYNKIIYNFIKDSIIELANKLKEIDEINQKLSSANKGFLNKEHKLIITENHIEQVINEAYKQIEDSHKEVNTDLKLSFQRYIEELLIKQREDSTIIECGETTFKQIANIIDGILTLRGLATKSDQDEKNKLKALVYKALSSLPIRITCYSENTDEKQRMEKPDDGQDSERSLGQQIKTDLKFWDTYDWPISCK